MEDFKTLKKYLATLITLCIVYDKIPIERTYFKTIIYG